jgi:hypothetical protein
MKKAIVILLISLPYFASSQDCQDCYLCEWVYTSAGEKVLYHTLENVDGIGGFLGNKEEHRRTGTYDQNCITQLKQKQAKAEEERKRFEASKEKIKNGEVVVAWHFNGKASKSMRNIKDNYNHISWYDQDGNIIEKFSNNKLTIYKSGQLYLEGPGIVDVEKDIPLNWGAKSDTVYRYNYLLHGICKDGKGETYIFKRGRNYTNDFLIELKSATTEMAIDELKRNYPFQDLFDQIEKRRGEVKTAIAYKEKYKQHFNEALKDFTYESLKKFNETYPDSVAFTMGVMKFLDPIKKSDTVSLSFVNNDPLKLKILDKILFNGIISNDFCINAGSGSFIECHLLRDKGIVKTAKININKSVVGEINYDNSQIENVWYRNFQCKESNVSVYYRNGKEYFRVYRNQNKVVYLNNNTSSTTEYSYIHYYGQDLKREKRFDTFIQEADLKVVNEFYKFLLDEDKIKVRKSYEESKYISTDVELFNSLLLLQYKSTDFNAYFSIYFADKAIRLFSNYDQDQYLTTAIWDFQILKAFAYWKNNEIEKALEIIKQYSDKRYKEESKRIYNGTGSPTYTKEVNISFKEEIKRIYNLFHESGIIFPQEKEVWKQIKSL